MTRCSQVASATLRKRKSLGTDAPDRVVIELGAPTRAASAGTVRPVARSARRHWGSLANRRSSSAIRACWPAFSPDASNNAVQACGAAPAPDGHASTSSSKALRTAFEGPIEWASAVRFRYNGADNSEAAGQRQAVPMRLLAASYGQNGGILPCANWSEPTMSCWCRRSRRC